MPNFLAPQNYAARLTTHRRKGLTGLLLVLCLAGANIAHADVFGSGGSLAERLANIEKELKELKDRPAVAGPGAAGPAGTAATRGEVRELTIPPPPGMEGLPQSGSTERERLIVEKQLTYEKVGTVNGKVLIREGERSFAMSTAEYEAFVRERNEQAVQRLKVEAVSESSASKVVFPQLIPPPPPAVPTSEPTPAASKSAPPVAAQATPPRARSRPAPAQPAQSAPAAQPAPAPAAK